MNPLQVVEAQPLAPIPVEAVWTAQDGAQERTSATDRARAVVIRSMPILALVALLALAGAITVGLLAGTVGGVLTFLVAMATVGSVVYIRESRIEYDHSRAGLERYRIDAAVEIKLAEMEHAADLRRQALEPIQDVGGQRR